MADEEGMQRKHKLLAAETNDYFCHTYPELTERWRQAMLTQPPSVLRDLSVELLGLESVTNRVNQELQAAHIGAIEGGEPIENLLDRALASMENLSEAAETMMRLLDELLA
jgi:hypothetical protein